jgi:predicted NBD/HSP70 family sugar kinase
VDGAPEEALDTAAEQAAGVLVDAGVEHSRVIGAGMALAAPIDSEKGVVGSTMLPSWAGIQAGEALSRRPEIPVELDKDANLGALAEVSFGAGRGLADVVYVMMSAGIGAGLVLGIHRRAPPLLGATHGDDLTLREMLELASDGDLAAKRVVNDAGRAVGRALADLCN